MTLDDARMLSDIQKFYNVTVEELPSNVADLLWWVNFHSLLSHQGYYFLTIIILCSLFSFSNFTIRVLRHLTLFIMDSIKFVYLLNCCSSLFVYNFVFMYFVFIWCSLSCFNPIFILLKKYFLFVLFYWVSISFLSIEFHVSPYL